MAGPLEGIKVLDLSRVLAGPWAAQTLADLGADVVKVERPGAGDDTRQWGPPYFKDGNREISAYFMTANRGKRSVTADMRTPEGQEFIKKLAARADIVVENFKVGGLEKYGLDYTSLKAINPGIIYCSITGFGQTGPYAKRAGYDLIIQAMGGLMSITGEPDDVPGGGPQRAGVAVSDLFTGLYSTIGILGALHHRNATGEGQHIDVALLDTQVAMLANQASSYLVSGTPPERQGNSHPSIVPYQSFATKDGHMILAAGNDSQFKHFCEAAGMPGLASDERYSTNPNRVAHRAELVPIVASIMKGKTTEEWITVLEGVGVPCGAINKLDAVFANEQVKARSVELLLEGKMPSVANPIKMSGTPLEFTKAPPHLGADTEDVLKELG